MPFSRRNFLRNISGGVAAAAVLEFPVAGRLFASPEPQRNPIVPGAILLQSNENAYGPLPSATKAMHDALAKGNRYPFWSYGDLASKIAAINRIGTDQLLFGAGSTELLRIAAETFTGPGKNLVVAEPTFEALSEFAAAGGAEVRKVPLTHDYAHDLQAILQKVDATTGLIYICNPNNPTASITPASEMETFLSKVPGQTTVVIDEAYHHFADGMNRYRSFMPQAGDRVVVLRTFSKIYGMAGIRLGYGVASPATIKKMSAYRWPIAVSNVAVSGGLASLNDAAAMQSAAHRNATDRAEFTRQAMNRKLNFIPSYANFFMVQTGRSAGELQTAFLQRNVQIGRPFPAMNQWIRVSLGLPEENAKFWQAWDEIKS
jgi:histidinol-phosphate aminotransferase